MGEQKIESGLNIKPFSVKYLKKYDERVTEAVEHITHLFNIYNFNLVEENRRKRNELLKEVALAHGTLQHIIEKCDEDNRSLDERIFVPELMVKETEILINKCEDWLILVHTPPAAAVFNTENIMRNNENELQ